MESRLEFRDKESIVKIMVIGVGGAGTSVVNRVVSEQCSHSDAQTENLMDSVTYVVANTDKQSLIHSQVRNQILLGEQTTKGQGAGNNPDVAEKAAEESESIIKETLKDLDLLFITAGMGGGTGTGASPVIAKVAKSMGILVIAAVSLPFSHEHQPKTEAAKRGIEKLEEHCDALIVVHNENLLDLAKQRKEKFSFSDVLKFADKPLSQGIRGITEVVLGYGNEMNVDFADIKTVMMQKGLVHMGVGVSKKGEGAGIEATTDAMASVLTNTSIEGAKGMLFHVSSSEELSFEEYIEMCDMVQSKCDPNCNWIPGKSVHEDLEGIVEVTIIATGIEAETPHATNKATTGAVRPAQMTRRRDGQAAPQQRSFMVRPNRVDVPKNF